MPRPPMYDAPETSATDSQALHMLSTLHDFVDNPYGDAHDVYSVAASDEAEAIRWPATAPPATASPGNEAGLVELEFHLHNIRDVAQHVAHQLAPLAKPPPPLPTDRPKPSPPLPKPPPPLPTAGQEQPSHLPVETHADGASEHVFLTELRRQLAPPMKSPPPLRPAGREPSLPQPAGRQPLLLVKSPPPPPPPPGREPPGREPPPPPPAGQEPPPADSASEHVLLSVEDLPALRQSGQPNAQTSHDEARRWTNLFAGARAEVAAGVQADLAAEWSTWKTYIARHKNADAIVGPGVVSFTAEFIEGTFDPNRGGIPRLDLVIGQADGGYVRLHPGSKPKHDAAPIFFSSSASEHAAYEWRTPDIDGIFTPTRANQVPQTDKLCKKQIWQTIQGLIVQGLITYRPDTSTGTLRTLPLWLDITDGNLLCWRLWICNLGLHTRKVIGTGVRRAHVAMPTDDLAVFKFTRSDDSECLVNLRCTNRTLELYVA